MVRLSVNLVPSIDWGAGVKAALHPWGEPHVVMMHCPLFILLDLMSESEQFSVCPGQMLFWLWPQGCEGFTEGVGRFPFSPVGFISSSNIL